jgi:small-conductance mechanosensitive channel
LRQQIDPIADAVASALDRLTPRLAEIKARLDQLGPKLDDSGRPESPAVTADRADQLVTSIGFHRNSLELVGVLASGVIRLALFVVAAVLVLAPWGLQSSDVSIDFGAAFFGFKVGDVTISPFSIIIAIGIFALAFAAFHAVLHGWTQGCCRG